MAEIKLTELFELATAGWPADEAEIMIEINKRKDKK